MDGQIASTRPAFRTVVDYMNAQDDVATKCFWTAYLHDFVPAPIGQETPKHLDDTRGDGGSLTLTCSVPLSRVAQVAAKWGVSQSDLAHFAWAATLRKFIRQNDVVFGHVRSNRGIPLDGAER
ncbi:hypothetical protein DYB32_009996 [Aphanomyces invadans]|uniref:Uncharacterized protein n=1 Tax=Aphanomyces invadans TaxID=157072 RepID=A0A418AGZ8_9STRA|nr:hypothetical protein DYB32_009996 [Aphanomyces invadans]